MKFVLWDTRRNDAQKDFAGGMGVGLHPGTGGIRGKILRQLFLQDRRPPALAFAYLAAILKRLGHQVQYCLDETPPAADVYIFHPALTTLAYERQVVQRLHQQHPNAPVLITGPVAWALPEFWSDLDVTVVRGEVEQLNTRLDSVLESDQPIVEIGSVADLDTLPIPDWSVFDYARFRIKYDFWRFPTAFIQQSRGCTFTCNYCPYIMVENKTRFRSPDAVVDEIRFGAQRYGFRSFKFRDPLFGLNRKRALEVAEGIGKLKQRIQFSIETRIDLVRPETLECLAEAGLTAITVGIETPDEATLKRYQRAPIRDDRQRAFIEQCRRLGIRTVAGFMIGFPHDTEASILRVLDYARQLNPTYANFNIVTPYPGTPFFDEVRDQIQHFDFDQYTVYRPVMKYVNLTSAEVAALHGRCFGKYYFRSRYFQANARELWPWVNRFWPRPSSTELSPSANPNRPPRRIVKNNDSRSHELPIVPSSKRAA